MEGECTYTRSKENTVIDHVIEDEEIKEKVHRIVIGEKVDSDHHLIEVSIEGGIRRSRKRRRNWGDIWDKEEKQSFMQKLREIEEKGETQE